MPWRLLGASVTGASHAQRGRPNQDALLLREDPAILAVADGHGSAACCRSATGAALAVKVAVEALARVTEHAEQMPEPSALDALPDRIAEAWRAAVVADANCSPLTDHETAACGGDVFRAYGTTLAAVAVTSRWMVAVQIGDGDVVVVGPGDPVRRPVPADPRLLGNETTSLALPEASIDFRLSAMSLDDPPDLILLATDGYANSFRTDGDFLQAAPDLLTALRDDGAQAVAQALPEWLRETSEEGSGDDITVGLAWRTD